MYVRTLKMALKEKGYTVKDLYLRINLEVWTSYDEVKRFCRSPDTSRFNPKLQKVIAETLKEMNVDWKGE